MKVATLKQENGKWKAYYNDVMLCQSADKFRVIRLITNGECPKAVGLGITEVAEHPALDMAAAKASPNMARILPFVAQKPDFAINQRFEFLENYTDMVIRGDIPSLLVTGEGGLGKTFTVIKRFEDAGLKNSLSYLEDSPDVDNISDLGDYITIKGFSTAKAMFRKLFENRNKLVIFDDCDKVLEDKVAIMILKGALDSTDKRWISWGAEKFSGEDDLPMTFEFKGGVIFISNKKQEHIDQAIKSRCMRVDLSMTTDEKMERIAAVMPAILPEIPLEHREEALDFLHMKRHIATDLNFRTFISVAKLRRSNPKNWQLLAEYTISA